MEYTWLLYYAVSLDDTTDQCNEVSLTAVLCSVVLMISLTTVMEYTWLLYCVVYVVLMISLTTVMEYTWLLYCVV
jgi:hypothetical protein